MKKNTLIRKTSSICAAVVLLIAGNGWSGVASACTPDGYIWSMTVFAGNFAIRGCAFAQGQLLAISSNSALFSILGTTYGGDGRSTFGLPDTRGRSVIGAGSGPGLSAIALGLKGGAETVTLSVTNLPSHGHSATTNLSGIEAALGPIPRGKQRERRKTTRSSRGAKATPR